MKRKKYKSIVIGIAVGILLMVFSVSAAILYNSSQVQYDNTNSGLNSTNVQSALDELKNLCGPINFSIIYINSSGTSSKYNYTCASGTTWKQFIDNDNSGRFYYDSAEVSFRPSSSNGWAYITNGPGTSTQAKRYDIIASRVFYADVNYYCCFEPDTLITIDFEGHTKKLKDIEVGDQIVVVNVLTGEKAITTVVKDASEHPETYDMTEITMEDGTKLKFNSYHPIYTTEGYKSVTNYNNYPKLEVGDYTVTLENKKVKIIDINNYVTQTPEMTYNLLIKGIKDQFLEENYAYIANGKLVHTGIARYDDEDEWRNINRSKCQHQALYKDFDYDKASDQEVIDFLVYLYTQNPEAENEYIKFYLTADQYFRYTEFAREVKNRIKNKDYNFHSNPYSIKNKKTSHIDMNDKNVKRVFE